ncbi:MAG: LIM domain-containing protein [Candidatus Helarchaeota archaeon]
MDNLSERLKEKKPKKDKASPEKKERIMGMHAEGDEINYIRCEGCGKHFPGDQLVEHNGLYYCKACFAKLEQE